MGDISFEVGDRVYDNFFKEGTIIKIDPKAQYPLGMITIKFDNGKISERAFKAHGLKKI